MPVYKFKLEDTVTGERRFVSVAADSKEEAEQTIYAQEMKKVNFFTDADDLKTLEAKLKNGTLSGRDKGRLQAHRQEKPYIVSKAKEAD